jgi:hypothetical protein
MRRNRWNIAGPLLLLSALAGCREGVVSPAERPIEAPSAAAPAPMSLAPAGRPTFDLVGGLPDSASVDFDISPNGGIFDLGNHAVVFPAQSVCDPATSSYGPGTWDDPCVPLQTSIRVHAEVRRVDGQTRVDFTPSLRFAPSTNPARWVWLVMYTPSAVGSADISPFNILWESAPGATAVDETPADSSLRTYVDTWQGQSLRRIKHFSGYVTTERGSSCDPAVTECH